MKHRDEGWKNEMLSVASFQSSACTVGGPPVQCARQEQRSGQRGAQQGVPKMDLMEHLTDI